MNMKRLKLAVGLVSVLAMIGFAIAETFDMTDGSTTTPSGAATPVVLSKTINFLGHTGAAGDVYKVIYIPTNFLVQAVTAKCVTTNTGTASAFIVGDSNSTCTWYNTAISMVSASAAPTQCTNAFSNGGKLYTAPDYISIVPTIAITNGSAYIKVLGVQL